MHRFLFIALVFTFMLHMTYYLCFIKFISLKTILKDINLRLKKEKKFDVKYIRSLENHEIKINF